MESLIQDVRFALRLLVKNPGLTVALLAAYGPVRRSTKVDPMVGVRHE